MSETALMTIFVALTNPNKFQGDLTETYCKKKCNLLNSSWFVHFSKNPQLGILIFKSVIHWVRWENILGPHAVELSLTAIGQEAYWHSTSASMKTIKLFGLYSLQHMTLHQTFGLKATRKCRDTLLVIGCLS